MKNPNIDLKKLNGQDWEDYRKMHKIATRPRSYIPIIGYFLLAIIVVVYFVYAIIQISAFGTPLGRAENYSLNQLNASLHPQVSSILNYTNPKGINNNTVNTLITTLQKSPKALAAFAVASFFFAALSLNLLLLIVVIVGFMIVYWIFFEWIPNAGSKVELPERFKSLERRLSRIQSRDNNLRLYGYTEQEIAWYHAVRSELIKLELEYKL